MRKEFQPESTPHRPHQETHAFRQEAITRDAAGENTNVSTIVVIVSGVDPRDVITIIVVVVAIAFVQPQDFGCRSHARRKQDQQTQALS
jgi:hypothetical protein